MHLRTSLNILTCTLLITHSASAQGDRLYHLKPDIVKVFNSSGAEKTMAWGGGMNNPQFGMADLNKDGKKDLVVFEPDSRIRTFINIGDPGTVKYRYEPKYEANFPKVADYFKFIDYNNDQKPDLLTGAKPTPKLYLGNYNTSGELVFGNYVWLKHTRFGNLEDFPMNSFNYPDAVDVDKDQDIDMISYEYLPSNRMALYHFKNMRTSTMPKDTVYYKFVDRCWGKFEQADFRREHNLALKNCSTLGLDLKPDPSFKTTGGYHAVCLFDADGDGDMDVLDGISSLSDIQFVKNGKVEYNYPIDTMITQDTLWPTGGKRLKLDNFPLGFWLDIDDDGDKDLIFSPFAPGSENYRCVHYYKNTVSDAAPNFVYETDTLFMDNMIDLGEYTYPALYDYNRDGKPDLFVGSRGYHRTGMPKRSQMSYFSNTSTVGDASLKQESMDFLNLSSLNMPGMAPAFGDLNADGKDDMVIGKSDGTLVFFQNMSASNNDVPNWVKKPGNIQVDNKDINVGGSAVPFIYDFDGDQDMDLIVGNSFAKLMYYENLGNDPSGLPKLKFVTDNFGAVHVTDPMSIYGTSAPFIGRIDNTNNKYLLVGSREGTIYRYSFVHGNSSAPFQKLDSFYSEILGYGSAAPVVGDLDGNGKYEMIIGTQFGGLLVYEQIFDVSVDPLEKQKNSISLYPNPTQREIILSVQGKSLQDDATVKVFDRMGRLIKVETAKLNKYNMKLDVSFLPQGVYMCTLLNGGEISSASFVKN